MPPAPPERPEFPWGGFLAVAAVVVVGFLFIRLAVGMVFGFVRLIIIVVLAVAVGSLVIRAKAGRS